MQGNQGFIKTIETILMAREYRRGLTQNSTPCKICSYTYFEWEYKKIIYAYINARVSAVQDLPIIILS